MKDPSHQITKGYFDLLNPIIPVFDGEAIENSPKPYAVLTVPEYVADSNKDIVQFERFKVMIDIVTDYKGQKQCDELAQIIINTICPNYPRTALILTDYVVDYTTLTFFTPQRLNTLTGKISRKILSFYHDLSEKT
jgi:hypothetical protein